MKKGRIFFEWVELCYLRVKVWVYQLNEERRVKALFYKNLLFKQVDTTFLKTDNPYKIAKAFPYGETPLTTLKQIADQLHIKETDTILELGCGRGRGVFFLHFYTGAKVIGVDWEASFIKHAKSIAIRFSCEKKTIFKQEDFFNTDIKEVTIIYLYGTCLEDVEIERLEKKLKKEKYRGKIITVSFPFPGWRVEKELHLSFPWGEATIFSHYVY